MFADEFDDGSERVRKEKEAARFETVVSAKHDN